MTNNELCDLAAQDIPKFAKLRKGQQRRIMRVVRRHEKTAIYLNKNYPRNKKSIQAEWSYVSLDDEVGFALISIIGTALLSFLIKKLIEWLWNRWEKEAVA